MIGTLTPLNQTYNVDFPRGKSLFLSSVFVEFPPIDKETLELEELRTDIGNKLFSSLSKQDRKFIIETEGSINVGYDVSKRDLDRISKYIEEYEQ